MANAQHYTGAAAEAFVAMRMLQMGYDVFTPMMTQSSADMIVLRKGKPLRVQVKKLTPITVGKQSYLQARLSGRANASGWSRDYDEDSFDYVALTDLKDVWVVPWVNVWKNTSITIGGSGKRRGYDIDRFKLKGTH